MADADAEALAAKADEIKGEANKLFSGRRTRALRRRGLRAGPFAARARPRPGAQPRPPAAHPAARKPLTPRRAASQLKTMRQRSRNTAR